MPHINRIRVNNVKYNVGTQFYDDLCLRFQGKNSLYDLANGGGKSVLMLLLLQNLIPNCTLDDKQPIEKLFRGTTGSNVIHSLIEWDLDKLDREQKGFRFMTTGFCARKKADRIKEGEEEVSSSAIEYFNYCIFYNEFQDYDILNLPLTNGNERISFKGLKELLKKLQSESNRKLKVKLFENAKGEYQRFIAGYGLYESQWNIIRGINKTEGHVRTYFESNYRTSRKVVEDLLIEEIIQKAYNLKTGTEKDTEELAETLLEIREQMVELSKKKQQIACYDKQREVIQEFITRFDPLMKIFEMRDEAEKKTSVFYHALIQEQKRIQEMAGQLEADLREMLEKKEETDRKLLTLDLQEIEYAFESANEEKEQKEQESHQLEESLELLEDSIVKKESVNYFLQYRKAQSRAKTIEAEINSLKQGNEELLASIEQMVAQKKVKDEVSLHMLQEQSVDANDKLVQYKEEQKQIEEAERRSDNESAVLASKIAEGQERLLVIQKEIRECTKEFPLLLREQISENLLEMQQNLGQALEEKAAMLKEKEELRENIQDTRLSVKDIEHRLAEIEAHINELEAQIDKYVELTKVIQSRKDVYGEQDIYRLFELLNEKQNEAIIETNDVQKSLSDKRKYLYQLEKGILFQVSEEVEKLKDYIYTRYQDGVLGSELVERADQEEKAKLLSKVPYLPYGIVVSNATYEKIKQQPKPEEWQNVSWMIPVISKELLERGHEISEQGVMFAGKDASYFLEKETLEKELSKTESEIAVCEHRLSLLDEQKVIYAEDRKLLQEYIDGYVTAHENWETELSKTRQEQQKLNSEQSNLKEVWKDSEGRVLQLDELLPQKESQIREIEDQIKNVQHLEAMFQKYDELEAKQRMLQTEKAAFQEEQLKLQQALRDFKEKIFQEEARQQLVNRQLTELEANWKRYVIYYKEDMVPEEQICENLEELLDGAITAFENENKDVRDKNATLQVVKEQEEASLRELRNRKADMEKLELFYTENQLTEVSEEELEQLREHLKNEEKTAKKCKERLMDLKELCAGYQSQAKLLESQIQQQYHVVKRLQAAQSEIPSIKEQLLELKKKYQREYANLLEQQKRENKLSEDIQAMTGRIHWLAEEYQIQDMQTKEMPGFVVVNFRETEREIRQSWQTIRDRKESTQTAFRKAKAYCEEELRNLGAGSFALQMKEQIQPPKNFGEAERTIQNLQEACVMIQMGRDQIESSLRDIEKIKNSFENQCLQRCNNIRVELDKFPKLSSIMIDEKLTQIVKLKIPYVKEEQQQMCIGNYLSQVIENLARYETEQEKKKYLIQELSMKRLFSAIVTDMNRISLELYKRERVKEQSRHLRYEEAVGSTGQSQGIYIQFLIAVINYIASMNSYHANQEALKKVIFIDNPFGAAKDTYIWEPIFAMLAANRVQLIVPTRGATPAIIGKFDVNYLLGQKMVGNKQQTVVVDYRSKIETEDTEYVKIDYEQVSLF